MGDPPAVSEADLGSEIGLWRGPTAAGFFRAARGAELLPGRRIGEHVHPTSPRSRTGAMLEEDGIWPSARGGGGTAPSVRWLASLRDSDSAAQGDHPHSSTTRSPRSPPSSANAVRSTPSTSRAVHWSSKARSDTRSAPIDYRTATQKKSGSKVTCSRRNLKNDFDAHRTDTRVQRPHSARHGGRERSASAPRASMLKSTRRPSHDAANEISAWPADTSDGEDFSVWDAREAASEGSARAGMAVEASGSKPSLSPVRSHPLRSSSADHLPLTAYERLLEAGPPSRSPARSPSRSPPRSLARSTSSKRLGSRDESKQIPAHNAQLERAAEEAQSLRCALANAIEKARERQQAVAEAEVVASEQEGAAREMRAKLAETLEALTRRTAELCEARAHAHNARLEAISLSASVEAMKSELVGGDAEIALAEASNGALVALLRERKEQAMRASTEAEELRARVERMQLAAAEAAVGSRSRSEERRLSSEEEAARAKEEAARAKEEAARLSSELHRTRTQAEAREAALLSGATLQSQMHALLQRKVETLEAALERERLQAREDRGKLKLAMQLQTGRSDRQRYIEGSEASRSPRELRGNV